MEENRRNRPPFSSSQNAVERILALLWLPIHLFLLPRVVSHFFPGVDGSWLNLAVYAAGAGYMLVTQFRFLRQDFDPLCDRPGYMLLEILISYGAMLLFNMAVSGILMLLSNDLENPNNAAVVDMAMSSSGPIALQRRVSRRARRSLACSSSFWPKPSGWRVKGRSQSRPDRSHT